ncbi:MAG: hypothetical protein FJ217_11750 [Ignavibacteria bacterium]|nr:hypothetical protein [Ignavibacteria bacterium]
MTRCAALVCLGLFVVPFGMLGQQGPLDFGRWKNFTDMKTVRGIMATQEGVWAATSGGLFLYTPSSGEFTKFTNAEGLSSNDLTAVAVDGGGRVWVGAFDGSINVYDPRTRLWREIMAVKESDRIQKGIRTFLVNGDTLLIGTDFGITVFLLSRFEFGDTYATFGFPTQAKINDLLIHRNRIWAATDLGVVSALLSAPNLSSPTAWSRYETAEGLPSRNATSIAAFSDTILVGTASGLAALAGNTFQTMGSTNGKIIVDLVARANDMLVVWNESQGYSVASLARPSATPSTLATNLVTSASGLVLQPSSSGFSVGTTTKGVAGWTGAAWVYVAPNGPQSNLFSSIVVDDNGVLWGASGISTRGLGFYSYDPAAPEGEQWRNYTVADYPVMQTNDYYKVSLGANGSVWVSSWGRGVLELVGDSIKRRLDQTTQPALAGSVPQDPNYVVVGGVAVDLKGNTWIVNRTAVNGRHLMRVSNDGSVKYHSAPSNGLFTNIVIDRNNTKWLANAEPNNKPATGLYYFNEDTLVAGTRFTGGWGLMTQTDGLPNSTILSLAVDVNGDVCVGTDFGMKIITDPLNPRVSSSGTTSFPLRGQSIQAIAVDAVNNKWVGTKEGVLVVTPDGVHFLAQYTVLSTGGKLVDNDVRCIAIDQRRGIVYLGTEKGLSSLEIKPVQMERNLTSLDIGPNPFVIPSSLQLTIRNLVSESSVKILTISGTLVTEFQAQGGGRAFWDGRDRRGELVPSGVYLVVGFAENGNQVIASKVAVVRR